MVFGADEKGYLKSVARVESRLSHVARKDSKVRQVSDRTREQSETATQRSTVLSLTARQQPHGKNCGAPHDAHNSGEVGPSAVKHHCLHLNVTNWFEEQMHYDCGVMTDYWLAAASYCEELGPVGMTACAVIIQQQRLELVHLACNTNKSI
jgi:hypothetical protein